MEPTEDTLQLIRSGAPPIRFKGHLLFMFTSHAPGGTLWYELALFEKASGGYVAQIIFFSKRSGEKDIHHVSVARTLDEAAAFFEGHDVRLDIPTEDVPADDTLPVATRVVQATNLAQRLDEAQREYGHAVMKALTELTALMDA